MNRPTDNRTIVIKTWPEGDWVEVQIGDELVFQGHSLGTKDFTYILWHLGHEVKSIEADGD